MSMKVFTFFVVLLVWLLILSQIIIPIFKRQPIFPMFNKNRKNIEARIQSLNEEIEVSELSAQADERESIKRGTNK